MAALGQRRVEASWHPDMAILPEVAQAHTAQHLAEVAAQSRVDFVERALAVQAMRSDVAKLEEQVRFRLLVVGSRKSGACVVVCSRRGGGVRLATQIVPKNVYEGFLATCRLTRMMCGVGRVQASRGREAYRKKAASVVEDTRTVLGRVKQVQSQPFSVHACQFRYTHANQRGVDESAFVDSWGKASDHHFRCSLASDDHRSLFVRSCSSSTRSRRCVGS